MNLTLDILENIRTVMQSLPRPLLVGFAMHPQLMERLRSADPPGIPPLIDTGSGLSAAFGIPYLLDTRLPADKAQCFYDAELWKQRVREQNLWDKSNPPPK